MKHWYALHTKPYAERRVALRLEHYDIETYLPEAESQSEGSTAKRMPFFPGYLFVHLDLKQTSASRWRTLPGMRYIVSYGDEPVPVREELIELIAQQVEAMKARQQQPQKTFEPGDHVRIKSGPFRDMIAVFEGPSTPAKRVQVLLQMISRFKRIRVAASDLEKVSGDEQESSPDKQESKQKRPRRTRGRGRRINS